MLKRNLLVRYRGVHISLRGRQLQVPEVDRTASLIKGSKEDIRELSN